MAKKRRDRSGQGSWLLGAAGVVQAILDRFGWPGGLLLYCIYFVQKYATLDQKRAIIDLYFLGRGISIFYPLVVAIIVFVLAFLAQGYYYRKKLKAMDAEMKRLGEWKTSHQEQRLGEKLHHSEQGGTNE